MNRAVFHFLGFAVVLSASLACGCDRRTPPETEKPKILTHEETLQWITEKRAWKLAKKSKPILARALLPEEIGKPFQTADQAVETAQSGYWLCVGIAGEPWFQKPKRIEEKYQREGEEVKQFSFDEGPRTYHVYKPRENVRAWAAKVEGPGIAGFYIRPNYDMAHPLYSPAGGYVVKDHGPDPYRADVTDVWLVQEVLFNSTYELVPE